jgi:hypothetical protein
VIDRVRLNVTGKDQVALSARSLRHVNYSLHKPDRDGELTIHFALGGPDPLRTAWDMVGEKSFQVYVHLCDKIDGTPGIDAEYTYDYGHSYDEAGHIVKKIIRRWAYCRAGEYGRNFNEILTTEASSFGGDNNK